MSDNKKILLQGNEAVVEGAIYAGMRFYAGYPITPSTEIAEQSAIKLPKVDGYFIQMEDELASMAAIIGGSVAGCKSMTATSGPGFSLMQENIGYAAIAEIPCVIVNVQRSGPSTGLPTSPSQGDLMQARWGTHGDHPIIAISPSSVQEVYELTIRCFNLAEKYSTPVILLMDEIVGHMREGIRIAAKDEIEIVNRLTTSDKNRGIHPYRMQDNFVPILTPFGEGTHYNITGLIHDEDGFPTSSSELAEEQCQRLMHKIEDNRKDIEQWEEYCTEDADRVIVCFGGTARSVKAAVDEARKNGINVGMFRPITVWPFPDQALRRVVRHKKQVVVAELNNGQMLLEVQRVTQGSCPVVHVGKLNGTILELEDILAVIGQA